MVIEVAADWGTKYADRVAVQREGAPASTKLCRSPPRSVSEGPLVEDHSGPLSAARCAAAVTAAPLIEVPPISSARTTGRRALSPQGRSRARPLGLGAVSSGPGPVSLSPQAAHRWRGRRRGPRPTSPSAARDPRAPAAVSPRHDPERLAVLPVVLDPQAASPTVNSAAPMAVI
jgi:hypothetical protein